MTQWLVRTKVKVTVTDQGFYENYVAQQFWGTNRIHGGGLVAGAAVVTKAKIKIEQISFTELETFPLFLHFYLKIWIRTLNGGLSHNWNLFGSKRDMEMEGTLVTLRDSPLCPLGSGGGCEWCLVREHAPPLVVKCRLRHRQIVVPPTEVIKCSKKKKNSQNAF